MFLTVLGVLAALIVVSAFLIGLVRTGLILTVYGPQITVATFGIWLVLEALVVHSGDPKCVPILIFGSVAIVFALVHFLYDRKRGSVVLDLWGPPT